MKRFIFTRILALVAILGIVSCSRKSPKNGELSGDISLSGAFALYPVAVQWANEFQSAHPYVHIDISAGGAGKGITDALAGVVDLGMVSRDIYPPEIARGAVGFAVAKDAVVPIINASNPKLQELLAHGLAQEAAVKIWVTGEAKTWGDVLGTNDNTPLHAYTRSDACGAAETWAQWLGCKQEDLEGTAVYGDPGVTAAVQKDIYGIGLNNIGYAYDNDTHLPNVGIRVMPIDADGDGVISANEDFYSDKDTFTLAVSEDRYPSPPARDLYLVTKGIPNTPAIVAFLKYILAEGQSKCIPAGYIGVSSDKIVKALDILESNKQSGEE